MGIDIAGVRVVTLGRDGQGAVAAVVGIAGASR
ncbi:hypothetical protein BH10PSE14_BH10PSE14_43070 [soil metagenome]